MPMVKCAVCRAEKKVRQADLDRGWGKFCSKRCKAREQEARTGQYAAYAHREGPHSDPYDPENRFVFTGNYGNGDRL